MRAPVPSAGGSTNRDGEITAALAAIRSGDPAADSRLLSLVYDDLCLMARRLMAREEAGHSLQPTDLVHETYLRIFGREPPSLQSRAHFFAAAGMAMRRILVERARRRHAQRRGGVRRRVTLDERVVPAEPHDWQPRMSTAMDTLISLPPSRSRPAVDRWVPSGTPRQVLSCP